MSKLNKIIDSLTNNYFSLGDNVTVNSTGILTDKNVIITSKGFTQCITVTELPPYFDKDIMSTLNKTIVNSEAFNVSEIKSYYEIRRASVDVTSPSFSRRKLRMTEQFRSAKKVYRSMDEDMQANGVHYNTGTKKFSFGIETVLKDKHKYDTFTKIFNHITKDNGKVFTMTMFFYITYKDKTSMVAQTDAVETIFKSLFLPKTTETIKNDISNTLENYSPATFITTPKKKYPEFMVTEKNITKLLSIYSPGIVNKHGVMLGTDMFTNAPVVANFLETPEASHSLIHAKTGYGKSFIGYVMNCGLVAEGYSTVYIDVKGNEVTRCLSGLMDNLITIDFSTLLDSEGRVIRDSKIFNPLILTEIFPQYTMENAIEYTTQILLKLASVPQFDTETSMEQSEKYTMLTGLFHSAIKSYYNSVNIKEDYSVSKRMTLRGILPYFQDSIKQHPVKSTEEMALNVYMTLESILDRDVYSNPKYSLDFEDIITYDTVIFDLGKGDKATVNSEDKVKILMAIICTRLIMLYRKAQGSFTHAFIEETPQIAPDPYIAYQLSLLATASRSNNFSMTIITNTFNIFKHRHMDVVRDNLQHFFFSPLEQHDIKYVKEHFSLHSGIPLLQELSTKSTEYKRGFLFHFKNNNRTFTTILNVNIPKHLTDKLATRDVVTNEEKGEDV